MLKIVEVKDWEGEIDDSCLIVVKITDRESLQTLPPWTEILAEQFASLLLTESFYPLSGRESVFKATAPNRLLEFAINQNKTVISKALRWRVLRLRWNTGMLGGHLLKNTRLNESVMSWRKQA